MTKAVVVALLLIHGAIHALGFARAFGIARVDELTLSVTRPWGTVWVACALLFVGAAVARLANVSWWWWFGAPAVVASQVAIIAFWSDARFGTVANALLLIPLLVGFGGWRFQAQVDADVAELSRHVPTHSARPVQDGDLVGLPPVVQTWLRRAGVVGRPPERAVYLTQRGEMKTSLDSDWMPFRAEQWFTTSQPGFVWAADVRGPFGASLAGRDRYLDAAGAMRVELLSLVPVVDSRGPTIDQGALVRYLAEVMWFPSSALATYFKWEAVDDRTARATLRHADVEVAGLFRFDEAGDVIGFEAKRYREDVLEDWIIENDPSAMKQIDGVRIPTQSTVSWRNDAGLRWTWLRLEILSVKRDPDRGAAAEPRVGQRRQVIRARRKKAGAHPEGVEQIGPAGHPGRGSPSGRRSACAYPSSGTAYRAAPGWWR